MNKDEIKEQENSLIQIFMPYHYSLLCRDERMLKESYILNTML